MIIGLDLLESFGRNSSYFSVYYPCIKSQMWEPKVLCGLKDIKTKLWLKGNTQFLIEGTKVKYNARFMWIDLIEPVP